MRRLRSLLALALMLSVAALPATAASQDAHEALATRLVAVLPASGSEASKPDVFAVERAAGLTKGHPAKTTQIAAAFADRLRCSDAQRQQTVSRTMLAVARSLGDEDLKAMIAFYTGPDHAASENVVDGSPEMDALLARYPLKRFGEAMKAQMGEKFIDQVFAAEQACDAALDATLAREGISE